MRRELFWYPVKFTPAWKSQRRFSIISNIRILSTKIGLIEEKIEREKNENREKNRCISGALLHFGENS